ncbi:hypothetical protein KIN20_024413 [Parelaphostrongylus tenuis]|uniref:Uncharacterized protein n=1 Tax=Parelaphostrongylus tenuis TaxID=148309 RepID=A0AAD5QTM6_PARTN|nr:hypothetical protein KIN20_024413 [Parelaphostrongylus tenuis]
MDLANRMEWKLFEVIDYVNVAHLDSGATTVSRKSSPPAQLRLWAGISRHGFWFFSDRSRYDNSATNIIMGNMQSQVIIISPQNCE